MTVLSAQTIRRLGLIEPCEDAFKDEHGNSGGLSACGYDLTLDKDIYLERNAHRLCGAREYFNLPTNVMGVVHDKSSWARKGIAVQNTVLEPGWRGYLTLEVTHHGLQALRVAGGAAIAQVVFHFLDEHTEFPYNGKYQDQERGPVKAKAY